jgi:hypothetical protein
VAGAVYAIDEFPDDDLLWRIEWIGGVAYNASVPSDPQIEVCLARLPEGETNPLSARACSAQTKRTVKIGVGLLPYISIASVWRRRRPVITNLGANRHRLCIDTSSCRMVPLADLANAIPRRSYLFGVSWPDVGATLLVTLLLLCALNTACTGAVLGGIPYRVQHRAERRLGRRGGEDTPATLD